jgi:hypothetical protein
MLSWELEQRVQLALTAYSCSTVQNIHMQPDVIKLKDFGKFRF